MYYDDLDDVPPIGQEENRFKAPLLPASLSKVRQRIGCFTGGMCGRLSYILSTLIPSVES